MPGSNITKRALVFALKELMETKPFSKISVSDICELCDMNRKSFYYHFKDKYDLVNWIYYTECVTALQKKQYDTGWGLMEDLCSYFYKNRDFYRKILKIEGQNSFSEYFRDIVATIISEDIAELSSRENSIDFYTNFYTDAFLCAIKRWLLDKNCVSSEKFTFLLKNCISEVSFSVLQKSSQKLPEKQVQTTRKLRKTGLPQKF